MAFRAFVAVPVPAQPALVSLLEEIATLRADVKPVEPQHLHFTLSFLGQVEDDARDAIEDAIGDAARGVKAFAIDLTSVGAFPHARRPRVVWVGVEDPKPLVDLALRVRSSLAARDIRGDDKEFRAHLTLARVKSERGLGEVVRFLRAHGGDEVGTTPADEVVLFQSRLGPHGPTYDALARAPLEA